MSRARTRSQMRPSGCSKLATMAARSRIGDRAQPVLGSPDAELGLGLFGSVDARVPARRPDQVDVDVVDRRGSDWSRTACAWVLITGPERAGGRGQRHVDDDVLRVVVDLDAVDQAEIDDADADLGVVDRFQRAADLVFGRQFFVDDRCLSVMDQYGLLRCVSAIEHVGRRPAWLAMAIQVDSLAQRGPGQQRAFDAGGVFLDTLQRVELFLELGRRRLAIGHALRERLDDRDLGLVQLVAFDALGHHRRRRLADRAAAPDEGDVAMCRRSSIVDRELDLVAAQRVVAAVGQRRMLQSPMIARVLVVVEDDLAREIFERRSLVLHPYLDGVAFDAHGVRLDGLEGGQLGGRAGADVEARAVARALDLGAFELALIERRRHHGCTDRRWR